MARPKYLTEEDKIQRKIDIVKRQKTIKIPSTIIEKFNSFSSQYKSENACIIDLIKTHPDFKNYKV